MGTPVKKMYVAQMLTQTTDSSIPGMRIDITNDSIGLVGMLPVFATKRGARKWFGRDVKLVEIELDTEADG